MPIKPRGKSAEHTPDPADSPFDPLDRGNLPEFKRARAYAKPNVEAFDGGHEGHDHSHGDNPQIDQRDSLISEIKKLTKLYEGIIKHPNDPAYVEAYINALRAVVARNDDNAISIMGAGVSAIAVLNARGGAHFG